MRVLGIDPGLTRCGMGVVEGSVGRPLTLVDVNVLRTGADQPVATRLVTIERGIDAWLDEYLPDAVAVERVFARSDSARSWAPPRPAGSPWSPPPAAGCPSRCTPPARSRRRSPATAGPTRPRSARWWPGSSASPRHPGRRTPPTPWRWPSRTSGAAGPGPPRRRPPPRAGRKP